MNNYTLDMLHELDYRKNLIAEQRDRIELLEKKCERMKLLLDEAITMMQVNESRISGTVSNIKQALKDCEEL